MITELLKRLITKKYYKEILQRKDRHRKQVKCILCNE